MSSPDLPQPENAAIATNTKKMVARFCRGDEFNGAPFLTEGKYRFIILHLITARSPVKDVPVRIVP